MVTISHGAVSSHDKSTWSGDSTKQADEHPSNEFRLIECAINADRGLQDGRRHFVIWLNSAINDLRELEVFILWNILSRCG